MSANDRQVGGLHYRSRFQHWDLAAKLHMGWLEYQITKYGTRYRNKNGRQDLEKAIHLCDKGIELARFNGYQHQGLWPTKELLDDYYEANQLNQAERHIMFRTLTWSTADDLETVKVLLQRVLATYPQEDVS